MSLSSISSQFLREQLPVALAIGQCDETYSRVSKLLSEAGFYAAPCCDDILGLPDFLSEWRPEVVLILGESSEEEAITATLAAYADWGPALLVVSTSALVATKANTMNALPRIDLHQPALFTAYMKALSDRERARQSIKFQSRIFHAALTGVEDAVITCDGEGAITLFNRQAVHLTGCAANEAVGSNINQVLNFSLFESGDHNCSVGYWLKKGIHGQRGLNQYLRLPNGTSFPVRLNVSAIQNDSGEQSGLVLAFSDISKQVDDTKKKAASILEDAITGLPERTLLINRLDTCVHLHKRDPSHLFALLFIDVDQFSVINEGSGHEVGDSVLRHVSSQIQSQLRDVDMLSRFSADTFVSIIDPVSSLNEIVLLSDAIRRQVQKPVVIDGQEVTVSVSIGIAMSNSEYSDGKGMMRDADIALHRAKVGKGNTQLVFDETMHHKVLDFTAKARELRQAIASRQIDVAFQPIVNAKSRKLVGLEALARWEHPTKGAISPGVFIPLAEETGMIDELGALVLEKVCTYLQVWQDTLPKGCTVGINLSASQFTQPRLAEQVLDVAKRYGIPPSRLDLEITESMAMDDVNQSVDILYSLRAQGLQVSIDDFGTGYSSLATLKRLPVHVLKVDRSFISNIENDAEDKAIVGAIVAMAKVMRLKVLVEGVENQQQAKLLTEMGCDYLQGFYIAKPMPHNALLDYFEYMALVPESR